jgi:ABC-type dipeptide/oligopeptide/nickel transport system ATPase component
LPKKILEVKDLVIRFRTNEGIVHAVNNVSFDLYEGETIGIVGESGSGKSVSMLAVMKLLSEPPAMVNTGHIKFKGEDISNATEEQMQNIRGSQVAMIFQDPMTSLNPVLTIGYQIIEPLRYHLGMSESEARKRASELLSLVGIPEAEKRLNDYPYQFSGGMRQRAMIAMALSCNPMLLIADEPTTALDVTVQAQIVELIKSLRNQFKMALIWITHDLGVVAGLADRLNVMYSGFIIETGPIDEIITRFSTKP